jgi:hypothetical protein
VDGDIDIFTKTLQIIRKLELTGNDVDGEKWNTSIPKLIDNAIIGFDRYLKSHTTDELKTLLSES